MDGFLIGVGIGFLICIFTAWVFLDRLQDEHIHQLDLVYCAIAGHSETYCQDVK